MGRLAAAGERGRHNAREAEAAAGEQPGGRDGRARGSGAGVERGGRPRRQRRGSVRRAADVGGKSRVERRPVTCAAHGAISYRATAFVRKVVTFFCEV